ncbi:MAG: 4Fe-4S dicluster domain-containing protein [Candidatus Bathyarchaeia archaeon]
MKKEEPKIARMDPKFKYELAKFHGAEKVMLCFQCGTCTADCPVGQRVDEFRPRQIARLAVLGLKERLFSGDTLWLCAGCYTCHERCPQDVRPTEVIAALRVLAVREGYIHPSLRKLVDSMEKNGYIYEITEFENEMREDMGLPAAPQVNLDEVRKIMKKTDFDRLTGITLEEEG